MIYDGVSSVLSQNHFWSILRKLVFVDNINIKMETKDGDRIWKLRPYVTGLRENFLMASPEELHSS